MTTETDRNSSNLPPRGPSLLDANFACNGLSLAENKCMKWGNSCLDNITIQNQSKFVNAAAEYFRKVLDEVEKDWHDLSAAFIEGLVSDLSLENDICERLSGGNDLYHHHKDFPVCVELETFSSSEDMSPNDLGHKKEKLTQSLADVSLCNRCTETKESCENDPYREIATHGIHHDEVTEGSRVSEVSTGLLETEGFSAEEAMLNVRGGVDANEAVEEFEDARMEDFSNEDGKYELVVRTSSYLENKKKLKFTFRWKLPSSKWYWGHDK